MRVFTTTSTALDPRAVAFARAHAWMEAMESGKFRTLTQLAQDVGVDEGYVRRMLVSAMEDFVSGDVFAGLADQS